MRISVIVPVYNGAAYLAECLTALATGCGAAAEILVVDDASTDGSADIAARARARVVRLARNGGPAAARNHGARQARGEILFFVDADVVVGPDAVARIAAVLDGDPGVAAVFGSYDARPRATGLVSRYRNLLHHFVHQEGNPEASTFWAGCGAIRRAAFAAVGGFDERRYPRPSIEDIELGHRLRRAGYRIRLDKTLQATHLKRWTLASVVRTDVACRALPWARLILATNSAPDDLNLKRDQRASVILVALAVACLPLAVMSLVLVLAAGMPLAAVIVLNRRLYVFFLGHGGLTFMTVCIGLHIFYFLYGGLAYLVAWLEFHVRPARLWRQPAWSGVVEP